MFFVFNIADRHKRSHIFLNLPPMCLSLFFTTYSEIYLPCWKLSCEEKSLQNWKPHKKIKRQSWASFTHFICNLTSTCALYGADRWVGLQFRTQLAEGKDEPKCKSLARQKFLSLTFCLYICAASCCGSCREELQSIPAAVWYTLDWSPRQQLFSMF